MGIHHNLQLIHKLFERSLFVSLKVKQRKALLIDIQIGAFPSFEDIGETCAHDPVHKAMAT